MMRRVLNVAALSLLLVAPVRAATPLDYTRTVLEQVHAVVAGNQTQDAKLVALSALLGKFLDTDAMGREALAQRWASFTLSQQKEFLACFASFSSRPTCRRCCCFRILTSLRGRTAQRQRGDCRHQDRDTTRSVRCQLPADPGR